METMEEILPWLKIAGGVGGWAIAIYTFYTMRVRRAVIGAQSTKLSAEADMIASTGFRELVIALKDEITRLGKKIEALQERLEEALKEIVILTENLTKARKEVQDLEEETKPARS